MQRNSGSTGSSLPIWVAAGVRSPFARVDTTLAGLDAIELSVPVAKAMVERLSGNQVDFAIWGAVIPNLAWSNIGREVLLDAGVDPAIPAFTTVMACCTSMMGAIEAAGIIDGKSRNLALVGGVESMSRVQVGLGHAFSDWLRGFQRAKTLSDRLGHLAKFTLADVRLWIPKVANRSTGLSMGEHTEITAKQWSISREEQDELALASHNNAALGWSSGFFDDLVVPVAGASRDNNVRADTSLEKLARLSPVFDKRSGKGTITAGNSSPLTDGAAALWVGSEEGMSRLPASTPRVRLVDFEISAVDWRQDGLLMAPGRGVPRLLERNGLRYEDVDVWEIHEAFAAQLASHMKAWADPGYLAKIDVTTGLGPFPRDRINRRGGSVALGHPFGATGARIMSQAIKQLAAQPQGSYAIVSVCADGGVGTMALLRK